MKKFIKTLLLSSIAAITLLVPGLQSAYGAQTAALSISPASQTIKTGDVFDAQIMLDTGGIGVDGVDIHYLRYNSQYLEVQDADSSLAGVQIKAGTLFPITTLNDVSTSTGTIDFSQITSGGTTFTGSGVLAVITFKVIGTDTADVTFDFILGDTHDTNVASQGQDALLSASGSRYTYTPTSTPPPSPPPAPVPTPSGGGGGGGGGGGSSGGGGGIFSNQTPPGNVTNFTATSSGGAVLLSWKNPTDTDFVRTRIMRIQGTIISKNPNDGVQIYEGVGTSTLDTALLTPGQTYVYHAFTFDRTSNYSSGVNVNITIPSILLSATTSLTTPLPSVASSSPPVLILTRTLFRGVRHSEVVLLQTFLIAQNHLSSGNATGYFGVLTEAAVRKYQCKNNIVCSGTPASTGWGVVGKRTRATLAGGLNLNQQIQSLLEQIKTLQEQIRILQGR